MRDFYLIVNLCTETKVFETVDLSPVATVYLCKGFTVKLFIVKAATCQKWKIKDKNEDNFFTVKKVPPVRLLLMEPSHINSNRIGGTSFLKKLK